MNDREKRESSSRTKTVMQIVMINDDADLFEGQRLKTLKGNRRRVSFV